MKKNYFIFYLVAILVLMYAYAKDYYYINYLHRMQLADSWRYLLFMIIFTCFTLIIFFLFQKATKKSVIVISIINSILFVTVLIFENYQVPLIGFIEAAISFLFLIFYRRKILVN